MEILSGRTARRSFNDAARRRYCGAPDLRGESEAFRKREVFCSAIDLNDEIIGYREDLELPEIPAHEVVDRNDCATNSRLESKAVSLSPKP